MYKIILSLFVFAIVVLPSTAAKKEDVAKFKNPATCEVCALVFGVAKNMLSNNYTDDEIISFIDNQFCNRLGSLSTACTQFIDSEGKQLLYELANDIDPAIICKRIGVCSTDAKVEIKPIKNTETCTICQAVVGTAEILLQNNQTEDEILEFAEKELCARLGSLNSTCVQFLETTGRSVLSQLVNRVQPTAICHDLKLCDSFQLMKSFQQPNSLNCTLCKVVFKQIQNVLESNATQERILNLLEGRLCNETGKAAPICEALVESFGPEVLKVIAQEVNPDTACTFIGMCTTDKVVVEPVQVNANPVECAGCQFIIHELEIQLQNNQTEAAIVKALEKVCSIVPSTLRNQCSSLVDTYGAYLVQLLVELGSPKKVCELLTLC